MAIRGIIFDLDGTLFNTFKDIKNAIYFVLKSMNCPFKTDQEYLSFIGYGLKHFLYQCLPEKERNQRNIEKGLALFEKYYSQYLLKDSYLYDGIDDLLTHLTHKKIPMGILSNKPNIFVQKIVSHLFSSWPFVCVSGALSDYPLKPDPTLPKIFSKKMQLLPQEILYVGDSLVDVKTSENTGFQSAFVCWGFDSQQLEQCHPDFVCQKPSDIKQIFLSQ